MCTLSQEQLDNNLLGQDRDITDLAAPPHLFVVSKEMEELISQNFLVIKEFKEHFLSLRKQDVNKSSVIEALFNHFEDLFIKVLHVLVYHTVKLSSLVIFSYFVILKLKHSENELHNFTIMLYANIFQQN